MATHINDDPKTFYALKDVNGRYYHRSGWMPGISDDLKVFDTASQAARFMQSRNFLSCNIIAVTLVPRYIDKGLV